MTIENVLIVVGVAAVAMCAMLWIKLRGPEDTFVIATIRVVAWVYTHTFHRLRSNLGGADPLPEEGAAIVVANHHTSVDPVLLSVLTHRRIHFLMAREYYEMFACRWFFRALECIPVNRDAKDLSATKRALRVLREGRIIGIFPQGGIRDPDDTLDGKGGVALLALRSGAPIIPFYISSTSASQSILRGLLMPSNTFVYRGETIIPQTSGGKSSRDQIDALTDQVLCAISNLASASETKARTSTR